MPSLERFTGFVLGPKAKWRVAPCKRLKKKKIELLYLELQNDIIANYYTDSATLDLQKVYMHMLNTGGSQ